MNVSPEFEEIVTVMASVMAYYTIAFKRFMDYIGMTLWTYYCDTLESNIFKRLLENLQVDGNHTQLLIKKYGESDEISVMRRECKEKLQMIEKVTDLMQLYIGN
mmetsp:Transcript_74036/g.160109  ORF Transcript_74036/g.160109 Transcript_74036/m.160109 type:complete len:104 (+) Transcript_74036:1989-2300(+)